MTPTEIAVADIYENRHLRFSEECQRFETTYGITLQSETDGVVSASEFEKIKNGEVDTIEALSRNDLWALLLLLHIDLLYVVSGKRGTD